MQVLHLNLRSHTLSQNRDRQAIWQEVVKQKTVAPERTAIIICDMWDRHWSRGASQRVDGMVPRMENVVATAREAGVHIIHAPSDTMTFYDGHPARLRMLAVPPVEPPQEQDRPDPPLPVDASDGGSDTGELESFKAWTRQHPALTIDEERDLISDNGLAVYSYLRQQQIEQLLIMGVHTNMCVLNRSFAIKQMVRWGQEIALVRDLTDTMYNPAKPPYVSHDEGTRLVIGYIERFWCPSVASGDILSGHGD